MKTAGLSGKRMVPCFIAIFLAMATMLPGSSEAQRFKLPDNFCGKRS